jgi:phospholipase/carboxylesterase
MESGEGIGQLKVLIQHGTADPLISIEQARESREQLRALGLEPDYHEYAMAHEITDASARDLTRWLERVLKLTAT